MVPLESWTCGTQEFDLCQSNGSVSITVYWLFLWTQLVFHLHHQVPPHLGWSYNIMQNSGLLHYIIFLWCEAICMHYAWKRLHCNVTYIISKTEGFFVLFAKCFVLYLFHFFFSCILCKLLSTPSPEHGKNCVFDLYYILKFWSADFLVTSLRNHH